MSAVGSRRATGGVWARSRVRVSVRPDAVRVGVWFMLAATALGLLALILPGFVRPGDWRVVFTADTVGLALFTILVQRMQRVSMLGVLFTILLIDGMIVLSGFCLADRSGGRVIAELFALPSLYVGLYAAAWMMIPQVVAVGAGALTIMVLGGDLNAMAVVGTFTILVSVFTPAVAALVLRRRLVAALRRARALSVTDPLTGLANRRAVSEQVGPVTARARAGRLCLGVVVADVDHFKRINDVHGHAVGDEVLKLVARAVVDCVRSADLVVRLGGEEFAVLTAAVPDDLADLAERIRRRVAVCTPAWPVTVSVGVAWTEPAGLDGDPAEAVWGLVDQADDRMYAAKRTGRNRVMLPAVG